MKKKNAKIPKPTHEQLFALIHSPEFHDLEASEQLRIHREFESSSRKKLAGE